MNQEFNAFMKDRVEVIEGGTSRNLYWYLAYPFVAIFNPLPAFDAERTGIGPYLALIAPFALIAVWRYRHLLISTR